MMGVAKVGDLVRCVESIFSWITKNKLYKVVSISPCGLYIRVIDNMGDSRGYRYYCFEYDLALNRDNIINEILEL